MQLILFCILLLGSHSTMTLFYKLLAHITNLYFLVVTVSVTPKLLFTKIRVGLCKNYDDQD